MPHFNLSKLCSGLLLMAIMAPSEGYSQELLSASFPTKEPKESNLLRRPNGQLRSLTDVLDQLTQAHKATFLYERANLEGKYTNVQVKTSNNVEQTLQQILEPVNLTFTKVKDNTFAIVANNAQKGAAGTSGTASQAASIKTSQAASEKFTVSGTVTDDAGEGVPGVTVMVKGTTIGISTDMNGKYTLTVPDEKVTLVFSAIGYATQEIALNGRSQVNVKMVEDVKVLTEFVKIGYQEVERKDLTGSVTSVGAKQLKDVPLNSAAEALTGRLAGVSVTTSEGSPGAEVQIRVRGGGSITQDNSPLYIVDGIQVENALSILSPQEIESIDVLKDAASTAIYGARGANGVVIITTKGGKEMPTQVTYNTFMGVRRIVNKLEVMNPYDFVQYQYQIYNFNTNEEARNSFRNQYGRYEDLDIYRNMPFEDWQHNVFGRAAMAQTHVLGLTGGTKSTSYNFTLNHAGEEGIMLESAFQRTLAAFKFDHKINERARSGFTLRYSRQRVDGAGTSSSGSQGSNRLRNSVRYRPFIGNGMEATIDEFDPDFANQTNLINPRLLARNELRYDYRNTVLVNGYMSYELLKNLTFKTTVGVSAQDRRINAFNGSITPVARQNNNQPVINLSGRDEFSINNSNVLTYRAKIAGGHSFDFLAGHEVVQSSVNTRNMQVKWFPVDISAQQAFSAIQKATPPNGLVQDAPSTGESGLRLLSYFGSASYNYKGKYLARVSMRNDASSLFSPQNRNGYFPSGSFAWRVGDENFMAFSKSVLTDFKVRVSGGAVGNNRINQDLWRSMYGTSANDGYSFGSAVVSGMVPTSLANPDLKWETTISRNLGFDFSLFERLNVNVDLYHNNTKNLLLDAQIPGHSGFTTQIQNIGKTQNRGLEIQMDGLVYGTKDFSWTANFNIAFNRNKIVSLGTDAQGNQINSYLVGSGWVNNLQDFMVAVGQPIGQYYGYLTDGYYTVDDFDYNPATGAYTLKKGVPNTSSVALGNRAPQPGDLKLKKLTDREGDNIGPEDRTILGSAQPLHIGGFNQQFVYKNFDMSIFMNWSYGNKVYNANKIEYTTQYLYRDNNMLAIMNDRWKWYDDNGVRVNDPDQLRAMNANAQYWTPSQGNYFLHSFAIEDGSFLRLSNLTLGYTLPEGLIKRTKLFSNFRVYATTNNLFTLTKYSGYDPEASTRRNPLTPGVDYAAYPRSRFLLGGVNITF